MNKEEIKKEIKKTKNIIFIRIFLSGMVVGGIISYFNRVYASMFLFGCAFVGAFYGYYFKLIPEDKFLGEK